MDNLLPIVGLGFEAHVGDCCVVVTCKCKPTNKPFLIARTKEIATCMNCHSNYAITKVEYDYTKNMANGPIIHVNKVMRTQ